MPCPAIESRGGHETLKSLHLVSRRGEAEALHRVKLNTGGAVREHSLPEHLQSLFGPKVRQAEDSGEGDARVLAPERKRQGVQSRLPADVP